MFLYIKMHLHVSLRHTNALIGQTLARPIKYIMKN